MADAEPTPKKTSPRKGTHAWRMSRDDYQPTAEDLAEQDRIKAEIQREREFLPDPRPIEYTRRVYKVAMLPSGHGILKGGLLICGTSGICGY